MTAVLHTLNFGSVGMKDIDQVGGKNSSLGEMITQLTHLGIAVPGGFATTVASFRQFLAQDGLDKKIYQLLASTNLDQLDELSRAGALIRDWILSASFSVEFEEAIRASWLQLGQGVTDLRVAVRSSATAEDLPDASFAGQQESYLNVAGLDAVLLAIKKVYASLFNDRAIAYRLHQGFDHEQIGISAGIQVMIRADLAASGVMFTLDTESGFDQVVLINAAYGLGELLVQGAVNPDEFYVHKGALRRGLDAVIKKNLGSKTHKMVYCDTARVKSVEVSSDAQIRFSLSMAEVEQLAHYALIIETHYGRPMDIEWAKDGLDSKLYILQARPETVKSLSQSSMIERFYLKQKSKILCEGRSIGQRIGQGAVKVIKDVHDMDRIQEGDVLVSDMTDPDWEPVMKRAAAIVTNRGGRTCHAAIIARELGIPAVVGCQDATETLNEGDLVTVSCAEGDVGYIYQGILPIDCDRLDMDVLPKLPVKLMLNLGNPERAFSFQSIPNSGVGLARLEFMISNMIGIHPRALLDYDQLTDKTLKENLRIKTINYASPVEYYIERLKEGIATIAAAFYPKPVIVRLSDFKSNEYAHLLGGSIYEPNEENPMLGFRGAGRYLSPNFAECFALECKAIRRVREDLGFDNVELMIPFVRTLHEAKEVIDLLKKNHLARGKNGLRIIMMCELPTNALLAEHFLNYFDGFSIGSNDLTQLTLGIDRDSALVAHQFDERDPAVKILLHMAITACKKQGKYIGICGQGPSDHLDFADWLVQEGIETLSLNPDSLLETSVYLAKQQKQFH